MTKIQFIKQDGRPVFAVVPIEIWERVKHLVEDEVLLAPAKRQDDGGNEKAREAST
ncbi:hypothetical protein [Burkholderia plantarii]|uniref:hypothetical protein n=1 Tax=Burkholderia plantarii TaxID=41899 RepID=UPI001F5B7F2E|nr:hypothetical protein [Burkholderia plantarii]